MKQNIQQVCKRCVMDTTDPHIFFDHQGFCNHCVTWFTRRNRRFRNDIGNTDLLEKHIANVRETGKENKYDCIIGVSGGLDSTYLAYIAVTKYKLRPLLVHLDNGWNSILALKNITNLIRKLDLELHTHVIDWEEFKSLQLAYLKASVIDIEALTDHAIKATLFNAAEKYQIPYILTGYNPATEEMLPKSWAFSKDDHLNILDINRKHGTMAISTYPLIEERRALRLAKKIERLSLYRYIEFDAAVAKKEITEALNWADYGGKHFESTFTKFYQGHILPRKFNVDKRKPHFSSLICLGELTRDQALDVLKNPPYSQEEIDRDYEYVIKKFGLSRNEFEEIMNTPPRSHFAYKTTFHSFMMKKFMVPTNPVARVLKRYLIK